MTSSKSVTPVKLKRKFLRDDETYTKKRKLNVDETNSTLNDYCSNKISDRKNRTEKFCKRSAVVDTNSTRSNYESVCDEQSNSSEISSDLKVIKNFKIAIDKMSVPKYLVLLGKSDTRNSTDDVLKTGLKVRCII